MDQQAAPRGWYDVGAGMAGMWDGQQWTGERISHEQLRTMGSQPPHRAPRPSRPAASVRSRPPNRVAFIVVALGVAAIAIFAAFLARSGGGDGAADQPTTTPTAATTPEAGEVLSVVESRFNRGCTGLIEPGYYVPPLASVDGTTLKLDLGSQKVTSLCFDLVAWAMTDDFGFTQSTVDRMQATRALDGELSATADGWVAYWRYHPDTGLVATIEAT